MSIRPNRRRSLAALTAVGVASVGLTLAPTAPAHAATSAAVKTGTASWSFSTWLGSSQTGAPAPYQDASVAPYSVTDGVGSWGAASGMVQADGSATLKLDGTGVNFAKTSGAWIKLAGLEVELDAAGNGVVSAEVSYGLSTDGSPGNRTYDDSEGTVRRAATRVDVIDLAGNSAADRTATGAAVNWTDLDGTYAADFIDFIDGDADATPAIPKFTYATQIATMDTPSPFSLAVQTATPAVTVTTTGASASGAQFKVDGVDFLNASAAGGQGVYVGLAPSGGLPDVSSPAGMASFSAVAALAAPDGPPWNGPGNVLGADGSFSVTLDAPASKLDKTKNYSIYTWQAHSHASDHLDTVSAVTIDWNAVFPPEQETPKQDTPKPAPGAGVIAVDVTKAPTTKKKGSATVKVTGGTTTPIGHVIATYKAGARNGKQVVSEKLYTLAADGTVTITLPKSAKGKRTLKVYYVADVDHKDSVTKVKVKVKK